MNVAIDGTLLNRLYTGVEIVIINLARSFLKSGRFNYTLFVPTGWSSGTELVSPRFKTVRVSVPSHLKLFRILWQQTSLPLKLAMGQYDLLHAPGYTAPFCSDIPVVVSVYDLIALDHPELCPVRNRLHFGIFIPAAIRKAIGIIVPSEQTRRDIESRFPFAASKIKVIQLGVSDMFHPEPDSIKIEQAKQRYGISHRYILFVGRLEAKKNLVCLVDAFHLLKTHNSISYKLVLAGCKGYGAEAIFRQIRSHGLESEVIITEGVSEGDLPLLYNGADVCVFPSLYEGFGLPVLESMACGTPVVISNRGALPETAGGCALIVNSLTPVALAEGIQKVLTDHGLRRTLIEKGLSHASLFTWTSCVQRIERFYEELKRSV